MSLLNLRNNSAMVLARKDPMSIQGDPRGSGASYTATSF